MLFFHWNSMIILLYFSIKSKKLYILYSKKHKLSRQLQCFRWVWRGSISKANQIKFYVIHESIINCWECHHVKKSKRPEKSPILPRDSPESEHQMKNSGGSKNQNKQLFFFVHKRCGWCEIKCNCKLMRLNSLTNQKKNSQHLNLITRNFLIFCIFLLQNIAIKGI